MSDEASEAYLEAEIGGNTQKFPIPHDAAVCIGRSESVGVVLSDASVSRRHALIQRADDKQYYITDLGSRNGTCVNQARISTATRLRHRDLIAIGAYTLTFCARQTIENAPLAGHTSVTNVIFSDTFITVLVADIRDFTPLAQHVAPSYLSAITGTLFREAGKALRERGAWAQKYIGDAIMAVWLHGATKPGAAQLEPVFDCMSRFVSIAASLQDMLKLSAPIKLGIGINTGWASIGNVGSIEASDYTAVGDVVNKAFRLESATRGLNCDLVLGEDTYNTLAQSTNIAPLVKAEWVTLKGYPGAVIAYTAQAQSIPALMALFS